MRRRRTKSLSGGGIPLSVPWYRKADTSIMTPEDMDSAREFLEKLPPAPPGRDVQVPLIKQLRRCKGCHGFNGPSHESYPLGAARCPLKHDSGCGGGIVSGKDSKGRDWRACPQGYLSPSEQAGFGAEDEYEEGLLSDNYSPERVLGASSVFHSLEDLRGSLASISVADIPSSVVTATQTTAAQSFTSQASMVSISETLITSSLSNPNSIFTAARPGAW